MIVDFDDLAEKQFEFHDPLDRLLKEAKKNGQEEARMGRVKTQYLRNEKGQFMSKEPKQKKEEMTVSKVRNSHYDAFNWNVGSSSDASTCRLGKGSVSFVTMIGFCAGGLLYYPYFNSVEEGTELLKQIEERASMSGRKYGLLIAFLNQTEKVISAFTNAGYKAEEFISPRYGRGSRMLMMHKIINQP